MPQALRLSDFSALTPAEQAAVLERLAKDAMAPPNGSAAATTARIRALEQRYEMSSAQLIDELRAGRKETAEIAEWLFLLELQRQESGGV